MATATKKTTTKAERDQRYAELELLKSDWLKIEQRHREIIIQMMEQAATNLKRPAFDTAKWLESDEEMRKSVALQSAISEFRMRCAMQQRLDQERDELQSLREGHESLVDQGTCGLVVRPQKLATWSTSTGLGSQVFICRPLVWTEVPLPLEKEIRGKLELGLYLEQKKS